MSRVEMPRDLLEGMKKLRTDVLANADELMAGWRPALTRAGAEASAYNLACYLALRRHDLRGLQLDLMRWGLSSLGRSESRVRATLDAVIATLGAVCHLDADAIGEYPDEEAVFKGGQTIEQETDALFGSARSRRRTRIMVTLPSEAALDPAFAQELVKAGADCVRINCAHDTPEVWEAMLRNLRIAESELGELGLREPIRVLMDLGGPKVRTVRPRRQEKDVYRIGDKLLLTAASDLERVSERDHQAQKAEHRGKGKHKSKKEKEKAKAKTKTKAKTKAKTKTKSKESDVLADVFATVGCTLPEALERLAVGEHVYIDDGQIEARAVERVTDGVVIQIVQAPATGRKIRSDKGLNFPDTDFEVASLTDKDRTDLAFVAQHADLVGYSFVQTAADIAALLAALTACVPGDRKPPALVLKIETKRAVSHLPDLLVHAAGRVPTAVMIARGDLAIELGFQRIAEMQEEILWLCEAASVPVIWATQVLDGLAKNGLPTRAEVTDAAMASRAECVMLNKGPYIMQAIRMLDGVLDRMEGHQHKKTPQLRVLHSWQSSFSEERNGAPSAATPG